MLLISISNVFQRLPLFLFGNRFSFSGDVIGKLVVRGSYARGLGALADGVNTTRGIEDVFDTDLQRINGAFLDMEARSSSFSGLKRSHAMGLLPKFLSSGNCPMRGTRALVLESGKRGGLTQSSEKANPLASAEVFKTGLKNDDKMFAETPKRRGKAAMLYEDCPMRGNGRKLEFALFFGNGPGSDIFGDCTKVFVVGIKSQETPLRGNTLLGRKSTVVKSKTLGSTWSSVLGAVNGMIWGLNPSLGRTLLIFRLVAVTGDKVEGSPHVGVNIQGPQIFEDISQSGDNWFEMVEICRFQVLNITITFAKVEHEYCIAGLHSIPYCCENCRILLVQGLILVARQTLVILLRRISIELLNFRINVDHGGCVGDEHRMVEKFSECDIVSEVAVWAAPNILMSIHLDLWMVEQFYIGRDAYGIGVSWCKGQGGLAIQECYRVETKMGEMQGLVHLQGDIGYPRGLVAPGQVMICDGMKIAAGGADHEESERLA